MLCQIPHYEMLYLTLGPKLICHFLKQFWLIIIGVLWYSLKSNFTSAQELDLWFVFGGYTFKSLPYLQVSLRSNVFAVHAGYVTRTRSSSPVTAAALVPNRKAISRHRVHVPMICMMLEHVSFVGLHFHNIQQEFVISRCPSRVTHL